ncbi:MAG TPA: hypothetical protein VHP33_37490, partial [Polyangiaceae bacterium]|nr:hypothetical protein [Polyangiaceae bacterium]
MAHRLSTVVRLLQLICCCVFVLVGASATARAQPDGSQSVAADDNPESKKQARARILTSLEELSPAEQESFLQLSEVAWDLAESAQLHGCVDDAGCALDQAFTGDWKATLGGVVKKLGARGGWKTGVLADLLPAALLEDATAESSAEAFLQTSRDKPECAKLQGGEIVLFSDIPKCTQALVVRKDYELLRVHAADATRIDLVTIGKRTQLQSYSEDRLKLHRVKDDAAWFVFFVPRASSVTL